MAKNQLAKDKVAAKKKIETAFEAGVLIGYEDGCKVTHEIWVEVAERVKGIGPKLQAALIQEARIVMQERYVGKFGQEIRPEVMAVRDYLREADKSER